MAKHLLFLIAFNLIFSLTKAQNDPRATFFYNSTSTNPAFAGWEDKHRILFMSRAYSLDNYNFSLSYDGNFSQIGGGAGVSLYHSNQKYLKLKLTGANVSYSLKLLEVKKFNVLLGIQAGIIKTKLDIYSLDLNKNLLDLSGGVLGKSENFYAGIAVFHLNNPSIFSVELLHEIYKIRPNVLFQTGAKFPLSENFTHHISPNILISAYRGKSTTFVNSFFNLNYHYKKWIAGVGLIKISDYQISGTAGFQAGLFQFTYTFETYIGTPRIIYYHPYNHEIALRVLLGNNNKKK